MTLMTRLKYKYLAPPLSYLLFNPGPALAAWLTKSRLRSALIILAARLFRRDAVAGTNIFSPDLYRALNPKAPSGFAAALLWHLREGEPRDLQPTYFFHTAWFKRVYQEFLPPGVSPLLFFMLRQPALGLRPHWRRLYPNPKANFYRALITEPDGSLRMSDRRPIWEPGTERPAGHLKSPFEETGHDLEWGEVSLTGASSVAEAAARADRAAVESIYEAKPVKVTSLKGVVGPSTLCPRVWTKTGFSSYLARLKDIVAIGADTAVCLSDGTYARDGNQAVPPTKFFPAGQIFQRGWLPPDRLQFWRFKQLPRYERGLLLMSPPDYNYWHWLVEGLVRIFPLADRLNQGDLRDCPIFISQGMPVTHEEALRLLVPHNPIIKVDRQMAVRIEDALYPSEINRVYESLTGVWTNSDLRIDPTVLNGLRQLIMERVEPVAGRHYPDRIMIDRVGTPLRALVNRNMVCELAARYGFELIRPEQMSFVEQVAVFSRARHILVPGGAGATNIIFAARDAQIGIFCNDVPGHYLSMWPPLAAAAEARLFFICGQRAFVDERIMHDQMVIPPDLLIEYFTNAGLAPDPGR